MARKRPAHAPSHGREDPGKGGSCTSRNRNLWSRRRGFPSSENVPKRPYSSIVRAPHFGTTLSELSVATGQTGTIWFSRWRERLDKTPLWLDCADSANSG